MKKWDWMLIGGICCIAAAAMFWNRASALPASELSVEIYLDSVLIEALPFPDAPTEYRIEGAAGYNVILLDASSIKMIAADCPGQDCVHTAPITRPHQIIACSPHRVLVQLVGPSTPEDVDAITG
jgi:Uncharacterized protein conserved in bacteria